MRSFQPVTSTTQYVDATATTQLKDVSPNYPQVRIVNKGTEDIGVVFGGADIGTPTFAASMPIPGGQTEVFTKGGATKMSLICDTGKTTKVAFTEGEGI